MGREIRRVPVDWEHPKKDVPDWRTGRMVEQYQSLFDRDLESAWKEWMDEYQKWISGEFEAIRKEHQDLKFDPAEPYRSFCEWNGQPPDPSRYRPRWADDAILGFVVYETVSEGTPVTPTFANREELIEYLVANGDFWDQSRAQEAGRKVSGWDRVAAERFVGDVGWAPSAMLNQVTGDVFTAKDAGMYPTKTESP